MKKIVVLLAVVLLILSFSTDITAQGMKKGLFLNIGTITDDSLSFDPFLWFAGFNIDFYLANNIMLSPEANVVTYKFKFDTFLFQPAVLLNFKKGSFFFGGGVQKNFLVSGDSYEAGKWGLKLNAGIVGKRIKLRVFADMEFDNLFKDMAIGFQIGIGI